MKKTIDDKLIKFREILTSLREYCNSNNTTLDQFVEDENVLSFPDEISEKAEQLIELINEFAKNLKNNNFLNDLFNDNEKNFGEWISEYLNYKRKTSSELHFIRELSDADFEVLFQNILKNYILEYNEIETFSNYEIPQIKIAIKAMNTFVKLIIDKMFSKKAFTNCVKEIFDISESKCDYIWFLIEKNKNELRYINIISKFK